MIDRSVAPPVHLIEHVEVIQAEKFSGSTNIPIHYINAGEQDVVKLEFVSKAGSSYEAKPGVSFFTTRMLTEGTNSLSSQEIADKLDYFGAQIDVSPGLDFTGFSVYVLKKFFAEIVPLIAEILAQSIFPQDELELQKAIKSNSLRVNLEKNQFLASRKIREILFAENHPYGRSLHPDQIPMIERTDLTDFFSNHFFHNPHLIISGKVSESDLQIVQKFFGDLSSHQIPKQNENGSFRAPEKKIIERPDSLQSSIRIGKPSIAKTHPDYLKLLVVNEILGGYFGSRLMKNIREDKGFTYGIYSHLMILQDASMMVIGTDVKKEHSEQTLDEIFKEINLLRSEAVPEEELMTVRNYMQGSFLSTISSPFALADKFKAVYFHGLDYSFYDNYLAVISSIRAEEILEIAELHINPEDFTTVLVGGI